MSFGQCCNHSNKERIRRGADPGFETWLSAFNSKNRVCGQEFFSLIRSKRARPRKTLGGTLKERNYNLVLLSRHCNVNGLLWRDEVIDAYGVLSDYASVPSN
jgi:hypothetical protein